MRLVASGDKVKLSTAILRAIAYFGRSLFAGLARKVSRNASWKLHDVTRSISINVNINSTYASTYRNA